MTDTPPPRPFRAVGRVVVGVDDLDEAAAFYRDVLGFAVLHDEELGGFRYLHVGPAGPSEAGLWLMPGGRDATTDRPALVLYCDDLTVVQAALAAHGVEPWNVRDDGSSRSLHLRDPAGNVLIAAELRGGASV